MDLRKEEQVQPGSASLGTDSQFGEDRALFVELNILCLLCNDENKAQLCGIRAFANEDPQ